MTKDQFERKTYRRSPGRQYGYDYDPLRSQRGATRQLGQADTSTADGRWPTRGTGGRLDLQFAQRPDPRRTRQLLRQHILAGKARAGVLYEEDLAEPAEQETSIPGVLPSEYREDYRGQEDGPPLRNRPRANSAVQSPLPAHEQRIEETTEEDVWDEFDYVDPDTDYEDPLERRIGHRADPSTREASPFTPRSATLARRRADEYRHDDEVEYEDEYEDELYQPKVRRGGKKRGLTRRKLIAGLGLAAVGGVAAYELAPRIPQALSNVGTNLEHQLEDAYNKGLTAGANAVRKELITGLDNLEGYSLSAAINVARLTRMAYDAFVSPIITLAATVTGDFLNATLQALQTARGFLSKFNQDNDTLNALQSVLQTWIRQVHNVPQEWKTITDTDLDGAQGYLRALQRKIQDEQAKLNSNAPPPMPTAATPKPTQAPRTH
jgi:hypothetical protein